MTPSALPSGLGVVLIVDDDKPIADYVAAVVAEAGYTPLVATRGALALVQERWPALLITDLMLPFMSGAALIAAPHAAAEAAGAAVVLRKPFDLAALEGLLRRFLGTPRTGQADQDRLSHS